MKEITFFNLLLSETLNMTFWSGTALPSLLGIHLSSRHLVKGWRLSSVCEHLSRMEEALGSGLNPA